MKFTVFFTNGDTREFTNHFYELAHGGALSVFEYDKPGGYCPPERVLLLASGQWTHVKAERRAGSV